MKILKYVILAFMLLSFPAYSSGSTLGSLRISLIEGDVQVRTEDTGEWVPASINMPLTDGDQLWVPEGGRTELQLRDGTFLRLDENSALEILTVEKDSFQVYLTEGRSYANFRGLKGSLLQVDTPDSSIRVYDRSNFRIETRQDGYTDISVYGGVVYAENRDGETSVDEGNTLSLGEGTYAELSPLGPPDEWERWNRDRDRRLAERRPPSPYLPDELQAYSSDFEENGTMGPGERIRIRLDTHSALFLPDGLPTGLADGYGSAAIMSGSLTNRGGGPPITMGDGLLFLRSDGAGFRLQEALSIGDPDL